MQAPVEQIDSVFRLSPNAVRQIDWERLRAAVGNVVTMAAKPTGPERQLPQNYGDQVKTAFEESKKILEPKRKEFQRAQVAFMWLAFGALALACVGCLIGAFTSLTVAGVILFGGSETAFCAFFFKVVQYMKDSERIGHMLGYFEVAFASCVSYEQHDFVLRQFLQHIGTLSTPRS